MTPSAAIAASGRSVASWKTPFDDPIPLPNGRQLVTLEDAAAYIRKLPRAKHRLPPWQTAGIHLIRAAEKGGGWLMLARIAMSQAIHHGEPPPPAPAPRKKPARKATIITGR